MRRMPGMQSPGSRDARPAGQNPSIPGSTAVGIKIEIGGMVQLRGIRTSGSIQEKRFLGGILRFRYAPARSVVVGLAAL